jgi:hypothetical protein
MDIAGHAAIGPARIECREHASGVAQRPAQFERAIARLGGFERRIASRGDRWADQRKLYAQFEFVTLASGGQVVDFLERGAQLRHRLEIGGATRGLCRRFEPHPRRARGEARFREMLREVVRLGGRELRQPGLDGLRNAGVQLATLTAEQRLIGDVANQRMLEGVGRLRIVAFQADEVGIDELRERGFERRMIRLADGREQPARKAAAHCSSQQNNLLRLPESVEARHQRVVQRGWYMVRVERGRAGPLAVHLAGFERRSRQFLDEERDAVRARDDTVEQLRRQLPIAHGRDRQIPRLLFVQAAQHNASHAFAELEIRASARAAGDQQQDRRAGDSRENTIDDFPGRGIDPVDVFDEQQTRAAEARDEHEHETFPRPPPHFLGVERGEARRRRQREAEQVADQPFRFFPELPQAVQEIAQPLDIVRGGFVPTNPDPLFEPLDDRIERHVLMMGGPVDDENHVLREAAAFHELESQSRFADTGFARDFHRLPLPALGQLPGVQQLGKLCCAVHQGDRSALRPAQQVVLARLLHDAKHLDVARHAAQCV